jgi:hypothetical protein
VKSVSVHRILHMTIVVSILTGGQMVCVAAPAYTFALVEGTGEKVCGEYTKLLTATRFKTIPQCGLPEVGRPGFQALPRETLSTQEVIRLFPRIYWFNQAQRQSIDTDEWSGDEAIARKVGSSIHVWRYRPPLNWIDAGSPENIIVWQGYGITGDENICGSVANYGLDNPQRVETRQYAFVLTQDGGHIDEVKTRRLFAPLGQPPERWFFELGWTMTPLKFENSFYVATFLEGSSKLIGLFREKNGHHEQICQIVMRAHGKDDVASYR